MSRHPERRRTRAAILVLAGVMFLGGCSAKVLPDASLAPTVTPSSAATETPAAPAAPALVAGGSAEENLPFFSSVVSGVWASGAGIQGRSYIDALVSAGFDKTVMQVTKDTSTVGNEAESIQFSVLWGAQCLVGQVGSATGEPVAVVVDELGSGGCLVGATRPIDW